MTVLSLADTRAELVASLEAASMTVLDHVPSTAEPGTVVIGADDPYLQQGSTFDTLQVSLVLFVIFAAAEEEAFTTEADTALTSALNAIPPRWAIAAASAPFRATNLGGLITSRVRISTDTQESEA